MTSPVASMFLFATSLLLCISPMPFSPSAATPEAPARDLASTVSQEYLTNPTDPNPGVLKSNSRKLERAVRSKLRPIGDVEGFDAVMG